MRGRVSWLPRIDDVGGRWLNGIILLWRISVDARPLVLEAVVFMFDVVAVSDSDLGVKSAFDDESARANRGAILKLTILWLREIVSNCVQ